MPPWEKNKKGMLLVLAIDFYFVNASASSVPFHNMVLGSLETDLLCHLSSSCIR